MLASAVIPATAHAKWSSTCPKESEACFVNHKCVHVHNHVQHIDVCICESYMHASHNPTSSVLMCACVSDRCFNTHDKTVQKIHLSLQNTFCLHACSTECIYRAHTPMHDGKIHACTYVYMLYTSTVAHIHMWIHTCMSVHKERKMDR